MVWDSPVRRETWSGCRLVKGVVQKSKAIVEGDGEHQAATDEHESEGVEKAEEGECACDT